MNVIAEFHVDGGRVLLGRTLSALSGTEIELEHHTANERGRPIFFLRVGSDPTSDDHERAAADGRGEPSPDGFGLFERGLATDDTVVEAAVIDEAEGRRLYRVVFATTCFYGVYRDTAAKLLWLVGSRDLPFCVECLCEESELAIEESAKMSLRERDLGLTAAQRATVLGALEGGYYHQLRTTDLETLAGAFDVSPQAIAGRLRHAHRNLVENTLAVDTGGLDEPPEGH